MKRKWRENEEIERKWRENEEMERDYFTTTLKYVTFSRKNLCIRSTHYDYKPKRLTFLRCVPNPHFNGVGMIVLSQHCRHDKSCASSRRRTKSMNNKETSKEEEQTWLC